MAFPATHESKRFVCLGMDAALLSTVTAFCCVKDAVWITIHIMENNDSGAGTAHNWIVQKTTAASGGTAETCTDIKVVGETGSVAGTILDTYAAVTDTSGVWASTTTSTTWNHYIISIDPASLGTNATDLIPNDWVGVKASASSANTILCVLVELEQRHKQASQPSAL